MKAISLWQPWASLWLSDAKIHETRHWPTRHKGWLLVHAAKRAIDDFGGERLDEICDGLWGHHWGLELPRGALIGMVNLIACERTEDVYSPKEFHSSDNYECGDFSAGRYGWRRGKFKVFDQPIPYRGQQGMFEVPDNILPKIAA
jgi:activating signal cointegrator 1